MHDKPVIYISGPMSGREDFNFPAFNAAADALRKLGYPVINPADFGADPKYDWRACIARDLAVIPHCNVIATLPDWRGSRGAALEVELAEGLGLHRAPVHDLLAGYWSFRRSDRGTWIMEANPQPRPAEPWPVHPHHA